MIVNRRARCQHKSQRHGHFTMNYSLLNLNAEQETTLKGIISGKIDPYRFTSVYKWVSECYTMPAQHELQMVAINQLLCGYGVEALRTTKYGNTYWLDLLVTYVNMGDTYTPTVVYHRDNGFMICSWGDLAENDSSII